MSALLEEDLAPFDAAEAHWSTGTIMAVFLAASMIAAVLVGLAYSFGLGATAERLVPMAMSRPVNAAERMVQSAKAASFTKKRTRPSSEEASKAGKNIRSAASHSGTPADRRSSQAAAHPQAMAAGAIRHSAVENSSRYMVQVGAIAKRRDARRLTWQLRRKGFHAGIYPGKHDRYLHVQIGPFVHIEQAQAVRHRVLASGFHATLKHAS